MYYGDNPLRPKLHFWFGPLSMVDCLGNYNVWYDVNPYCSRFCWWPGTCHESPMYDCKLGIPAALTDIQNNHPNDFVSLIMFSVPQSSADDTSGTRFNRVRVGLGQNYSNMQDSLWYPPATVGNSSATVTPYDCNNIEVPRATGGTCYSMPLMLAYNQFSANSTLLNLQHGTAGRRRRRQRPQGSAENHHLRDRRRAEYDGQRQRLTDNGPYNSYYNILLQQRQSWRQRVSQRHQRLRRQRFGRHQPDQQHLQSDLRSRYGQPAGLFDGLQAGADPLHGFRTIFRPRHRAPPRPTWPR